jgi:hypothetical protein
MVIIRMLVFERITHWEYSELSLVDSVFLVELRSIDGGNLSTVSIRHKQ